jgi:DNA repair protein RadD
MLQPRDYQQAAHDAVIAWWRKSVTPCVVEAATGAGKSVIIAMISQTLHKLSNGKRVLCLAPSAELVQQNADKYQAIGERPSIYSASIGKSLRERVIFATEGTFKKVAARLGHEFAGVIIDEAHRLTPTIKKIVEDMRVGNPNLRVCGLSATPYRLDSGFIFAQDFNGQPIAETKTKEPYFARLVYCIGAKTLIERGYLTAPRVGDTMAPGYDTSGLELARNGQYTGASVDRAFVGWGRKTSAIVADVVTQATGRRGVMFFAATVQHAQEIMASLPPELSALVTGETPAAERASIIARYKAQRIKYLVNVSVLTTGFDAPHVDTIAIMRATESVSLLQQIIGRGLRIDDGKTDALILDYAGNLERHCLDGDLFRPEVRAPYQTAGEAFIDCHCPECDAINIFSARENDAGLPVSKYGYLQDLDGHDLIDPGTDKPMPAHYGRRCRNLLPAPGGQLAQCGYYWSCKICPACETDNDIAARYCRGCKEELINPNEKLIALHTKAKKDPARPQCDEVLEMAVVESVSKAGNPIVRVSYTTAYRLFTVYYQTNASNQWAHDQYQRWLVATNGGIDKPRTVKYYKDGDFWKVTAYGQTSDDENLQLILAA